MSHAQCEWQAREGCASRAVLGQRQCSCDEPPPHHHNKHANCSPGASTTPPVAAAAAPPPASSAPPPSNSTAAGRPRLLFRTPCTHTTSCCDALLPAASFTAAVAAVEKVRLHADGPCTRMILRGVAAAAAPAGASSAKGPHWGQAAAGTNSSTSSTPDTLTSISDACLGRTGSESRSLPHRDQSCCCCSQKLHTEPFTHDASRK